MNRLEFDTMFFDPEVQRLCQQYMQVHEGEHPNYILLRNFVREYLINRYFACEFEEDYYDYPED